MRVLSTLPLLALFAVACSEYDMVPEQSDPSHPIKDTSVDPSIPVAVCSADPETVNPPFGTTTLHGEESYDPNGGEIVEYDWWIDSKPEGSSAELPVDDQPTIHDFAPDLAGDYIINLVVVNQEGVESDPCTVDVLADPMQNLWVEMYWEHEHDDMDLHLLAPGGEFYNQRTDCYFANCVNRGLDWGVHGDSSDDPSLDIDDIPGTGPENINIAQPEEGVFTVIVDDYVASGGFQHFTGANNVTVNIYIDGALEYTDTKPISGEGTHVTFATIDWPTGTVQGH